MFYVLLRSLLTELGIAVSLTMVVIGAIWIVKKLNPEIWKRIESLILGSV